MGDSRGPPGFVVGGVRTGVGKTVATLAIVTALEAAGYSVQPAKAGPDVIDPSHHEAVAGRPSRTLDLWLSGTDGVRRTYARGEGDLCVVEGMMGLYDGDVSSTAMIAEALDLPIVLVVDANAGMESVAATAHGFRTYAEEIGREIDVAGIVAQRAHGGRHERGIREALPDELEYFGRIQPDPALEIPDRHLGLHMGEEAPVPKAALERATTALDVDRLAAVASSATEPEAPLECGSETGARVAVADDAAFCFRYPSTIERVRERAELVTFSPLAGDPVPDCDGVYLPGGYPELYGDDLESSETLEALGRLASEGLPVLGECGGLMAMSQSVTTTDGKTHVMAEILPADVTMHDRYQAIDHVELEATCNTLIADADDRIRGHEFHYSSAEVDADARFAFETVRGMGIDGDHDGLIEYETLGTYAHVHPESGAFDTFLERL